MTYLLPNRKKSTHNIPNPPLENLVIEDLHTINLNSKYSDPSIQKYEEHYKYIIHTYIKPFFSKFQLWPEISPRGRFHYHGVCQLKDLDHAINWYMYGHHVPDCQIEIDTIDEIATWLKYCTKQQHIMTHYAQPLTDKTDLSQSKPQSSALQLKHSAFKNIDYKL